MDGLYLVFALFIRDTVIRNTMQTTLKVSSPEPEPLVDDSEEEKNTCPVCGAEWVKKKPTLAEVRSTIWESIQDHTDKITALDGEGLFGYCGSIATGAVGSHKSHVGLEPDIRGECGTKYDVDGFLQSDSIARTIPKFRGKGWAYKNKSTRDQERDIRNTLMTKPALEYMNRGKTGFSVVVYLSSEQTKIITKGCITIIF